MLRPSAASSLLLRPGASPSWRDAVKGGAPGFVRVTSLSRLIVPDCDGNRMYKSLGDISLTPRVGLLFMRFGAEEARGRVLSPAAAWKKVPLIVEPLRGSALRQILTTGCETPR